MLRSNRRPPPRSNGSRRARRRSKRRSEGSPSAWRGSKNRRTRRAAGSKSCTRRRRARRRDSPMFERLKQRLRGWQEKAADEVGDLDAADVVGEKGRKVREKKLEEILPDLEIALLEADVAHPVVEEILKTMREELLGKRITRDVSMAEGVEIALKHAVERALAAERLDFLEFVKETPKPVVIMFVGVNGTGKTTTIAKVVNLLQKNDYSVVLAAADTFRAGAIEQLEVHANRLGTKLIKHAAGADPAAVAFDAVEHARARHKDVVLIDTAGRMQTNQNLMDQMKKIKRVANPHMVIFVGDA